ncbi:MAG: DNA topoisomerase IV subunit B [Alphaproteobacteria bacterium]|nr:DNA topoisomerase IV subunit B [Alphaproteobacteria bacterium]
MNDLFSKPSSNPTKTSDDKVLAPPISTAPSKGQSYNADAIEILEGLEPVRRRPGMYIGGTDETALHHLFAEILDNAMDEALSGFARHIHCQLHEDGAITVSDNGRGIPCDPHPRYPEKSALEVILTSLHSGGKFSGEAYEISGGLHGVGISVVNALSDRFCAQITRAGKIYQLSCVRGAPTGKLTHSPADSKTAKGTKITFHPDPEIFGNQTFNAAKLYKMTQAKAYLHGGIQIFWQCPLAIAQKSSIPATEKFHYPGGLKDYMAICAKNYENLLKNDFDGDVKTDNGERVQWVLRWFTHGDSMIESWCNAVPTPQGGYHETAMRQVILRGLRHYGELTNNKRAAQLTSDDVINACSLLVSIFIREPQFQGQTKEKLVSPEASRLIDNAVKDQFEHWLTADPVQADLLLQMSLENMDERLKRRAQKNNMRKSPLQRLRLPGKLSDCSTEGSIGTELFIVEGDSAGGSAKQARNRNFQAVLPLRGKILNVASASVEKLAQNHELSDLCLALGCGTGDAYRAQDLRYEKIVIMTDADVDGAHIAALLMTFFYRELPELILDGHLYLAMPPLYRIALGGKSFYAHDDNEREQIIKKEFRINQKPDISRFKGLGEMPAKQLRDTTMNPETRNLMQVRIPEAQSFEARETKQLVEDLLGRNPEKRFDFIRKHASFAKNLDI